MKTTILFTLCSIFLSILSFGQTSTEQFETESHSSNNFTDNGVIFNILSHTGTFDIQANFPGTGWSGTSMDNRYIDNSNSAASNASFSVKTTSNLFKANRFWVFLSDIALNQNISGTLTVTGKLSGVTKFIQTKTTGFVTSLGSTNGYTLIDLTNLNGQNYSNIVIDQLQITIGGNYTYCGFDAFTWVKDSNIVLGTNEINIGKKLNEISVYPNPTNGNFSIKTENNSRAEIYDETGKMTKTIEMKTGENMVDISELPNGVYIIKANSQSTKIIKK